MQVDTYHKNKGYRVYASLQATKTVFTASWTYVTIAAAVAAIFWIVFASFDQLLFFSPVLTFYLPEDALGSFVLSTITAAILGVVISMNVYALNQRLRSYSMKRIKKSKSKTGITSSASLFSGSSMSILSTVCASCSSSLGLVLTSLFGTGLGASISTLLSNYQTPLQMVSILILIWSWYSISKSLSTRAYCPIPSNSNPTNNDN